MVEPLLTQSVLDAFAGVRDSSERVQWQSLLRLTDFLLRGGSAPNHLRDGVVDGLRCIMDSDADSERHLFSCMSLMLLGQTDAEPHLNDYMNHECETFRANAARALALGHDLPMPDSDTNEFIPTGSIPAASPIEYWAAVGNFAQVQQAIADGHDVNATSDGGYTALHAAAENNHVEIAQLLLKHGAEASAAVTSGETPSDLAALSGHHEMVKLLSK